MSVRTASLVLAAVLALATGAAGAAGRHLIVVSGLGGEPDYAETFHRWSARLVGAARERLGLAGARVVWLAEDPARDPDAIDGRSDAATLEATLAAVAGRSAPGDVVMIVLIGHGTARPGRALFNVPGPDLSARALAAQLDRFAGRTVVVVNTTSASGAFLRTLSASGRVVAAATASGAENQHTRFAGHFAEAYAGDAADVDKDGRVSVLEAFDYARREVRRDYERDRRLLAEHAVLDDDGDGRGAREPAAAGGDGALARTVYLAAGALDRVDLAPGLVTLETEARELVADVEAHRRRKPGLAAAEYEAELERLLVELALNRRAVAAWASR